MWPAIIFAANLNPREILRAKYEINSINTNKGSKAKGQPAGTKREKNLKLCFWNPKIVAPKTIVKLRAKVKTSDLLMQNYKESYQLNYLLK